MHRREADVSACVAEREAVLVRIGSAFGGALPEDPIAEVDARAEELRGFRERLTNAEAAAKEADAEANRTGSAVRSLAARSGELVGSLRSLPVARLLERAREAVPDLEAPVEASVSIPPDPAGAAAAARDAAKVGDGAASALRRAIEDARRHLDELVDQAREALPPAMPVALVTDFEELLQATRAAARDLVEVATASRKDAERLAQRLTERRELETQAKSLEKQAAVYHALAAELRADRLIDFLQEEALELLAEAGSERLLFLSQGRYRLVFEDDEFFVEDRQNGEERRSVRTLSGGETFLASLALAL